MFYDNTIFYNNDNNDNNDIMIIQCFMPIATYMIMDEKIDRNFLKK